MALRDRLDRLRRQSGAASAPQSDPPVPSVAERVARLRVGGEPSAARRPPRADHTQVAAAVGGHLAAPGVVLIEHRHPLSALHGRRPLSDLLTGPLGHLPEADGLDPAATVFLDTETSGLDGGTGTVVFLLGMARVEGAALLLRQYLLLEFSGEAALLAAAGEWLGAGGAIASFNGKAFDLPLLGARCRLAGLPDPFAGRPHLDLLFPIRRGFARAWPDCRLATAEERLLAFRRRDDLPGAEVPDAWFAWLHRGEAGRLPRVVEHNRWDLVSLAALLPALAVAYAQPGAWGADVAAVARAHLRRNDHARALALLEAHRDTLDPDGLRELARLYKRQRRWDAACAIWEPLAAGGCSHSVAQLAMYHEHQRRDFDAALRLTEQLPPGDAAQRRRARLQRRGTARAQEAEAETAAPAPGLFD